MLGSLYKIFSRHVRPHVVPTDEVYPVHFTDQAGLINSSIISYTFRFDDVLDPHKLHDSLVSLLEMGDWRKLGGRLRRDEHGRRVICVPKKFSTERPAVRFSHVTFTVSTVDHPLGNQLPKVVANDRPSIHKGCHTFRPFSLPEDLPNDIEHYYTTDEPLISMHITSFTDSTLISTTYPHLVCDAMGMGELLRAWSSMLRNQAKCVPNLLGAKVDVIEDVGSSCDEEAQKPYILEPWQIKGLSLVAFVARFVWDLITRRKIEARGICLPEAFLNKLRHTAYKQLAGLEGEVPFLSDGDLITAWGSRMILSSSLRKRPATICNVFDIRGRLENTFRAGGAYIQNLILPASLCLSATEAQDISISEMALRLRHTLIQQTTDSQARRLMRVMKASIASTGLMPLFGGSSSRVLAFTNWSRARLMEAVQFGPAVIPDPQRGENTMEPGSCVSYWGTTLSKTDNPRDTFIIYGKDRHGNYWLHAYLRPETWKFIEADFKNGV